MAFEIGVFFFFASGTEFEQARKIPTLRGDKAVLKVSPALLFSCLSAFLVLAWPLSFYQRHSDCTLEARNMSFDYCHFRYYKASSPPCTDTVSSVVCKWAGPLISSSKGGSRLPLRFSDTVLHFMPSFLFLPLPLSLLRFLFWVKDKRNMQQCAILGLAPRQTP